jgi:transposase
MSRPYSMDLRERVVASIEAGASRHEAAERFGVSVSSAIRWMQRFVQSGTAAAKRMGGSTSALDGHADWFFRLIAERPDLTLDEIVVEMERQGIPGRRGAVWRFFQRHRVTVKKSPFAPRSKSGRTSRRRADAGCASKACLIRPGWCSSMRPRHPPIWRGRTAAACALSHKIGAVVASFTPQECANYLKHAGYGAT